MKSDYFIHTFELIKPIETDVFLNLKRSCAFILADNYSPENEIYVNRCYADNGLMITMRKCSDNEIKTNKTAFVLELRIDPNKLIYKGNAVYHIHDRGDFKEAVEILREKVDEVLGIRELNDIDEYILSRLDIARDVHGIPESIIHEVNTMLYRIPMYEGYKHNTELEDRCRYFRREDSFNAVNSSRGIEFVVYNKHQAALDNNYADSAIDFYKDTVRIELRCKRKYIDKHFKGKCLRKTLLNAYDNMQESVEEIYGRLFKFPTDLCQLNSKQLIKCIFDKSGNKKARCRRMVTLIDQLDKHPEECLQNALDYVYPGEKRQRNIKKHFEDYGVSPLSIRDKEIPFIQSLDSLLSLR